jgi:predicted ATPase
MDIVHDLPSGTVTFLFTDIEGSTRLLEELGDGYVQALDRHRGVLRDAFERHGGVEVDTQGDAFFAAFRRASDAVAAAADAQGELEMPVRIGIHTGEPTLTPEGYVGMDVHRAARICAAAHGRQVVVSRATRDLVEIPVVDLGEHRLKDLGQPIRLYQLGDTEFPPLRSLNQTNLPAQPSQLVGRERELQELLGLVRDSRLVTLTGPGGSGKTRLALQTAAELVERFEGGVFWVPLAAVSNSELVEATIAQTIGAQNGLAAHVADKQMLLLLDNFEQVVEAASGLSQLLEVCPKLHLLTTSRALLRIAGEREYPVEPLPEEDAVDLFRERAAVAEPLEAVHAICRRLDGLPLAIELAAARTRLLPPDQLLERLERALPVLTAGRRDAPERQRTLRSTIEWSYDLLDEEEQRLFRRLAVFAGSFTVEAAEEACDADLGTLESLLEQSLLRRWASGRLGMLETIREYAAERLDESDEAEEMRGRHAEYFLELGRSANLYAEADGPQRHALVLREQDNLRAAITWAESTGKIELALSLAVALENFWANNSPFEGAELLERLLARAENVSSHLFVQSLRVLGSAADQLGQHDRAERAYEQSLDEARALGDERGVAITMMRLGASAVWAEKYEVARPFLDESLELSRRIGNVKTELQALGLIADVAWHEGERERAVELESQSLELARKTGFTWWLVGSLQNMAERALEDDRLDEAWSHAHEGLELAWSIGNRQYSLYGLAILAATAAARGETARAGKLWGAIEAEEERGPVGAWEAGRHEYLSRLESARGDDFDRGLAEGRSLTLEAAVQLALADD